MPQDEPRAHPDQPTGTDILGGTRAGAENVEPVGETSIHPGPDLATAKPLDQSPVPGLADQHGEHAEPAPERDERARS